jgi:hypothetical protein
MGRENGLPSIWFDRYLSWRMLYSNVSYTRTFIDIWQWEENDSEVLTEEATGGSIWWLRYEEEVRKDGKTIKEEW